MSLERAGGLRTLEPATRENAAFEGLRGTDRSGAK
jgi:hypothetical protein